MSDETKQKLTMIGINHVALEVGNIDEALEFYGKIFNFKLRSKGKGMAFVDLGDQFLALFEQEKHQSKSERHFGLVVDDRTHLNKLLQKAGVKLEKSDFVEFYDPWNNLIQVVEYKDIQFTKTPQVLKAMGVDLKKSDSAIDELAKKGMI